MKGEGWSESRATPRALRQRARVLRVGGRRGLAEEENSAAFLRSVRGALGTIGPQEGLKMLKTLLGIAASPVIAIGMFCFGLLFALLHLLALPVLFLWERYLENNPARLRDRSD
jgi:hypothetical protein